MIERGAYVEDAAAVLVLHRIFRRRIEERAGVTGAGGLADLAAQRREWLGGILQRVLACAQGEGRRGLVGDARDERDAQRRGGLSIQPQRPPWRAMQELHGVWPQAHERR